MSFPFSVGQDFPPFAPQKRRAEYDHEGSDVDESLQFHPKISRRDHQVRSTAERVQEVAGYRWESMMSGPRGLLLPLTTPARLSRQKVACFGEGSDGEVDERVPFHPKKTRGDELQSPFSECGEAVALISGEGLSRAPILPPLPFIGECVERLRGRLERTSLESPLHQKIQDLIERILSAPTVDSAQEILRENYEMMRFSQGPSQETDRELETTLLIHCLNYLTLSDR
jgi:hypothetical protein